MTAPRIIAARHTAPSRAVRARDVLSFEWTKLRSVRSNYWTLSIAAAVSVGVTAIAAHSISAPPGGHASSMSPLTSSFLGYAEYAILPMPSSASSRSPQSSRAG